MYSSGQKIQVIESNCKNKAGPRTGSLGFIETVQWFNSNIDNLASKKYYCCLCKIRFYRYGFGKYRKPEFKHSLTVFPLSDKFKLSENEKEINKVIDSLIKDGICRIKPVITIIKPLFDNTDLLTCTNEEFLAWYTANTYNKPFVLFLDSLYDNSRLQKYKNKVLTDIDTPMTEWIQRALHSREVFRNEKDYLLQKRYEAVKTILLLKTRNGNKNLSAFKKNLNEYCSYRENIKERQEYLATRLLQSLFTYSGFDTVMSTYTLFKVKMDSVANNIIKHRNIILNTQL